MSLNSKYSRISKYMGCGIERVEWKFNNWGMGTWEGVEKGEIIRYEIGTSKVMIWSIHCTCYRAKGKW